MLLIVLKLFKDWLKTIKQPIQKTNFVDDEATMNRIDFLITDKHGVMARYNVDGNTIINLSGGIPIHDFTDAWFRTYSISRDVFKTEMRYDLGADINGNRLGGLVDQTIDFSKGEIIAERIVTEKNRNGFGINILVNQITQARKLGFKIISLNAAGGIYYPPNNPWVGYKVWCKFGFIMSNHSQMNYTKWKRSFKLKEKTLNILYLRKKNYQLWESHGFDWDGYFDLRKRSWSLFFLKLYLNSKNINVKLNLFRNP